jgi:K+-sensing histidine kinase KdpD
VIEVKDRGLGLTPEEQKHIFEKFYRAPSHESRLIAGTGLGLTLVAISPRRIMGARKSKAPPAQGALFLS